MDEDLAEWNAYHGNQGSASASVDIVDPDIAEWNAYHSSAPSAPVNEAPSVFSDPIGAIAGTSNWSVSNLLPNLLGQRTFWGDQREDAIGALKGVAKAGTDIIAAPADLMYRGGQGAIDLVTGTESDLTGTYPSDYRNSILEYISGGEGDKTTEAITHAGGNIATLLAAPSQAQNIAAKIAPYISKVPGAKVIAPILGLGTEGAAQSIYMNPKGDLVNDATTGAALNIGAAGLLKGAGKLWDKFIPTTGAANRGAQGLADDIANEFRTVAPQAFEEGLTLEQRATQAARGLDASAMAAKKEAGALFKALPEDAVYLDDALSNIHKFADDVGSAIKPGSSAYPSINKLQQLKPADKIIETPASTVLDEFGQPVYGASTKVIKGGPTKIPLTEVQNTLRDIGKLQRSASGVDKLVLGKAKDEILAAAERSVSPESMKALTDARTAWAKFENVYNKSAVGAVRKSLLEPGKRLSTLKTKLLNDPKSAQEITAVMTPKELSNVQNIVLMDLTSKAPVTWEKAIAKQYDSYKHIFGEEGTENLLKMVSREGSVGSKLLKDNNGLGGLLAKTGMKGIIGGTVGYEYTGDWKGAALGAVIGGGKGRLEGKIVNQAKSLLMRGAVGSPEALKILNSIPESNVAYSEALKKLAVTIPASIKRANQEETTQQSSQSKTQSSTSSNYTTDSSTRASFKDDLIDRTLGIAEGKIMEGKTPKIVEEKKVEQELPKNIFDMTLEQAVNTTVPESEKFLSKVEGGQQLKAYPPPAKGSGVTVATGVDLGQHSKEDLERMGVSSKTIQKVHKYLGKKDATARLALKEKPLELKKEEAEELDNAVKNDIFQTVDVKFKNATGQSLEKLPPEAQTVVKSLAYNFGKNFDKKIPTIWKAIVKKDWTSLQSLLQTTKWKQPELKSRRIQEAKLLDSLTRIA